MVLFGLTAQEQEGIYSLRGTNTEGLPQDTIIVFESGEDAERWVDSILRGGGAGGGCRRAVTRVRGGALRMLG